MPLANNDLNPNAVPTKEEAFSTYGNVAQETDLPPSSAFEGEPLEEVEELAVETEDDSLFSAADEDLPFNETVKAPPALGRPLATSMLAIATADISSHPAIIMQEKNLQAARDVLDSQQEFNERLSIASKRQQGMLIELERYRNNIENARQEDAFSQEAADAITSTYNDVVQQRVEDNAKTSLEYEVVERVQDSLANRDPIQAKVIWDLYAPDQRGDSQKVIHDEAVKNLILAQRIEELENEADEEGWGSFLTNFVLSLVPSSTNFDRSGILDDAGIYNDAGGLVNFFLTGNNLERQSESLWNLSPEQFALAMDRDGPVMRAIRDNAGLGRFDPSSAVATLNALAYQSESDKNWANTWGVVDPATLLPWGKGVRVAGSLTRLGARKQAVETVANSYDEIVKKGAKKTREETGVKEIDVIEEIEIKPASDKTKEVSRAVDINAHIQAAQKVIEEMPKTFRGSRFTSADELAAAFEASVKGLEKDFGKSLKDTKRFVQNVTDGDLDLFAGTLDENGDIVGLVEGTFGKKNGGGFAREATARAAAARLGFDTEAVETIKDVSGQWFYTAKFNVRDEGFITSSLDTPAGSLINNLGVRSTSRIADQKLQAKALNAGNRHVRLQAEITKTLKESLKGVSKSDKQNLDQVIRKGQNEAKWFSPEQFNAEYERLTGKLAPKRTIDAYKTYVVMNDVDYVWRNNVLYTERARKGAESVKFQLGNTGVEVDTDAVIKTTKPSLTIKEAFDATEGKFLTNLGPEEAGKMLDDGYVRMQLEDVVTLPDGTATNSIFIRKPEIARSPLRRNVLAYSPGGHRAYAGNYYVKQAAKDVKGRLLNPHTFITGNNKNTLAEWAEKMNTAIDDFNRGITDAAHYDDEIFKGQKGLPDGEEFLNEIEAGRISKDSKIEVVFDRDQPSEYLEMNDEVLNFVDETETPVAAHARTTGRMYYSRKGEHLKDEYGEFAETLDPWETLNTSLSNIARMDSFSSYKMNALERFKKTYGNGLNLKDVENTNNLYELIKAPVKEGLPLNIRRQIKQEQQSMRLILNHETGFEKAARQQTRAVAEWALGDSVDKGMRQAVHDGVFALRKNNPVAGLRGLAFDAKLGLFNFGQFFIQTSTALSATALNPKYGFKGLATAFPMLGVALAGKRGGQTLDLVAKRGVWKSGGFANEAEFKEYGKLLINSGIMDVGNTHAQINLVGPNRVFGAASKLDSVREAGRVMFYAAEQINRATAARIAWGELTEQGVRRGSNEFKEKFVQLTDDYSLNMMQQSQAAFQSGAVSIPTQFWSYSFRMMDAMLGKRFTTSQKAKLWIASGAMAGTAGIPLGEQFASYAREANGGGTASFDSDDLGEQVAATFERGLLDRGLYELFNADVRAGEKIGTAGLMANVIADLFGNGQYGEKSTAEMLVGATGSISVSAFSTLASILKYSAAEMGGNEEAVLTPDLALELAKEISIVNNGLQAIMVNQYGIYKSKRGTVQADNIPSEAAFFIAMGLQPQKVQELSNMFEYFENKDESIKDAAKVIRNYRQEAFTNPDKYEANMAKVNAFVQMLPDDIRQEVQKQSSTIKDKSLYDALGKKWEKEMLDIKLRESLNQEQEDNENAN